MTDSPGQLASRPPDLARCLTYAPANRTAADQVARKSAYMPGIRGRVVDLVAKLAEEPAQLVEAAVYVAGDVERPVHVAGTVPEALALEDGCLDLLDTVEDVNAVESFLP